MYTWMPVSAAADLENLKNHIPEQYEPGKVAPKLATGISAAVKGVLIERRYIDKDYRSTYYQFYAKKGQQYDPDCIRLHLFDGTVSFDAAALKLNCPEGPDRLSDHYFGYIVLRPTGIATIGRSVVSPDVRTGASRYIITADHKVHLLGYRLSIQGFPSMDQHVDISVCAHVACWSILRHYSERYSVYREFLTYDITLMAQEFNPGGLVPSKGLQVSHAERVFQEAGTFPVHVARSASATPDLAFYGNFSHTLIQDFRCLQQCISVAMRLRSSDMSGSLRPRSQRRACATRGISPSLWLSSMTTTSPISQFLPPAVRARTQRMKSTLSSWPYPRRSTTLRTLSIVSRVRCSALEDCCRSRLKTTQLFAISSRRDQRFVGSFASTSPSTTQNS